MKTSAATSDAHKAATDHDAPFATAMAAAAQPQAAAAITRVAASPGRLSRALGAPGSRPRSTNETVGAAGQAANSKERSAEPRTVRHGQPPIRNGNGETKERADVAARGAGMSAHLPSAVASGAKDQLGDPSRVRDQG